MEKQTSNYFVSMLENNKDVLDLPETDKVREIGTNISKLFTDAVATLLRVPNPRLVALAQLAWKVTGNKIVPVVLNPPGSKDVDVITFMASGTKKLGVLEALIVVPLSWPEMVAKDIFMELGGVVKAISLACDFYNGKLIVNLSMEQAENRARAYEAELILTFLRAKPDLKINDYQKHLIHHFPQGLDTESVKSSVYTFKPFQKPN